jgi:ankyrin repeat protein
MELWQAVFQGDDGETEKLLQQRVDTEHRGLNQNTPYDPHDATAYTTPLQLAVCLGKVDIVRLLLKHGACIFLPWGLHGPLINTAIVCTSPGAELDTLIIVSMLLARGADVNELNDEGVAPLHSAAFLGSASLVHLLIEHKANVKAVDDKGVTPLHRATNSNIVEQLLSEGADVKAVDNMGRTPLQHASMIGSYLVVEQLLLTRGVTVRTVDNRGISPLHSAVIQGSFLVVVVLLEHNADIRTVDNRGQDCLKTACSMGHTTIALRLLERWEDLYGMPPYSNSLRQLSKRHPATYAAIDRYLGPPNWQGRLRHSVVNAYIHEVRKLITDGADVNETDYLGWTALHVACYLGYTAIARILVSNGADMHRTTDAGCSIRFVAHRHPDTLAALEHDEKRREKCLAFACSHHKRLGLDSLFYTIEPELLRFIIELTEPPDTE